MGIKFPHAVVITGGPRSGRTTMIKMLAHAGFKTLPDVRLQAAFRMCRKHGAIDSPEMRFLLETEIVKEQLEREEVLAEHQDQCFIDGGIGDSYGLHFLEGMPTIDLALTQGKNRYGSVFMLDSLPDKGNDFRQSYFISICMLQAYYDLGYNPISVPVLSQEERFDLLLKLAGEAAALV